MTTWAQAKQRCSQTMFSARKRCNEIMAETLQEAVDLSECRQEAARRLGMRYRTFYSACQAHGIDTSGLKDKRGTYSRAVRGNPQRNAEVVAMLGQGKSRCQVAKAVGITKAAVSGIAYRHRVSAMDGASQ